MSAELVLILNSLWKGIQMEEHIVTYSTIYESLKIFSGNQATQL